MTHQKTPKYAITTALADYLAAWKDRDWEAMHGLSQITWQAKEQNSPRLLELWYPMVLTSWEIGEPVRIGPCMYRVPTVLQVERVGKCPVNPHLVCETAPYAPTLEGTWGVNPISMLNRRLLNH